MLLLHNSVDLHPRPHKNPRRDHTAVVYLGANPIELDACDMISCQKLHSLALRQKYSYYGRRYLYLRTRMYHAMRCDFGLLVSLLVVQHGQSIRQRYSTCSPGGSIPPLLSCTKTSWTTNLIVCLPTTTGKRRDFSQIEWGVLSPIFGRTPITSRTNRKRFKETERSIYTFTLFGKKR